MLAISSLAPTAETFVTTRMVASETALSDSLVRPVILRLEKAGLLARLPRSGGPRSMLYYQTRQSALWEGMITTCAAVRMDAAQSADAAPGVIGHGRP